MKKGFLPTALFASFLSLVALQGCKKDSAIGIDNDTVVKTPYSLYVGDSQGAIFNTTDGEKYGLVFPSDGYAPSLIITSGNNLLVLKQNLHMSTNNGKNFNPVYTNVKKFPWQTMAYNSFRQGRLYITSNSGRGIAMSKDNGKTWEDDMAWETNIPPAFEISSFSGIANSTVFAYSNLNNVMFKKVNNSSNWAAVTMEGLFPVDGTQYYLSSNGNTLFLTDYNGLGGVWYSEDEGFHWKPFGLVSAMTGHHWNCAASPSGGGTSFLVGVDTNGVYRVENGAFKSSTTGLEVNTTVYSMAVKSNTYKNDATRNYVFIATNKGMYRSEDNGYTWDKMTFGEFDGKYKAAY